MYNLDIKELLKDITKVIKAIRGKKYKEASNLLENIRVCLINIDV